MNKPNKNFVYGLKGIAKLLGVSKSTAFRIKKSGEFDEAIYQRGKTIIADGDKILSLFGKKNNK